MTPTETIEKFLLAEVASDHGKKSLLPEEDLLEQGIIDSLGIMKLVVFMEEAFGIEIADDDIVPENFQSLSSMAAFVEQMKANK
jgi:acyl carrier protein